MSERKSHGVVAIGLLMLLTLCTPQLCAAGGPELSGFYRLSDVVALNNNAQVIVHVRLVNHSNTAVALQNLLLRYSPRPQGVQKLNSIVLPPQGRVEFAQKITVEPRDYQAWANRMPLALSFSSTETGGYPGGQTLVLMPLPVRPVHTQQPRPQSGGRRP
jgi:hypothetical protein